MVVGLGRASPRPDKCSGGKKCKKKGEEKKKRKKTGRVFSRTGGKDQKLGREGSNLTSQ